MLYALPLNVKVTTNQFNRARIESVIKHHLCSEGYLPSRHLGSRRSQQYQHKIACATGFSRNEENRGAAEHVQTISVDPIPHSHTNNPPQRSSLPASWPLLGAAAAVIILGLTRTVGALRRRRNFSDLEARGMLDESRHQKDPYLEDVMASMGRVQYGDLTEKQIKEARMRRSRARRGKDPPNEEDIDIPSNHPFAKREQIPLDQQELMSQRLRVKRGLPLQDLKGTRGLPGMPIPQFQPPHPPPPDD